MKKNIISFIFFVILTSCLANVTRHNFMPPKSLYGYWSLEGVTWLKITSDSIYFVDAEVTSPIKYSVNKDTIIWYLDGIIQKSIYNCTLSNKSAPLQIELLKIVIYYYVFINYIFY